MADQSKPRLPPSIPPDIAKTIFSLLGKNDKQTASIRNLEDRKKAVDELSGLVASQRQFSPGIPQSPGTAGVPLVPAAPVVPPQMGKTAPGPSGFERMFGLKPGQGGQGIESLFSAGLVGFGAGATQPRPNNVVPGVGPAEFQDTRKSGAASGAIAGAAAGAFLGPPGMIIGALLGGGLGFLGGEKGGRNRLHDLAVSAAKKRKRREKLGRNIFKNALGIGTDQIGTDKPFN